MFFKFVVGTFIYAIATATLFTTEINQDKRWIYFGIFSGGYSFLVGTLIYKVLKRKQLKRRQALLQRQADENGQLKLTRDRGSLESNRVNSSEPSFSREQTDKLREQVDTILNSPSIAIPRIALITPLPIVLSVERKNPSRKASLVPPIPIIPEDE